MSNTTVTVRCKRCYARVDTATASDKCSHCGAPLPHTEDTAAKAAAADASAAPTPSGAAEQEPSDAVDEAAAALLMQRTLELTDDDLAEAAVDVLTRARMASLEVQRTLELTDSDLADAADAAAQDPSGALLMQPTLEFSDDELADATTDVQDTPDEGATDEPSGAGRIAFPRPPASIQPPRAPREINEIAATDRRELTAAAAQAEAASRASRPLERTASASSKGRSNVPLTVLMFAGAATALLVVGTRYFGARRDIGRQITQNAAPDARLGAAGVASTSASLATQQASPSVDGGAKADAASRGAGSALSEGGSNADLARPSAPPAPDKPARLPGVSNRRARTGRTDKAPLSIAEPASPPSHAPAPHRDAQPKPERPRGLPGSPVPPAAPAAAAPAGGAVTPNSAVPGEGGRPEVAELCQQGMRLLIVGQAEAARGTFERALALDPRSGAALRGLGLAHQKLGARDTARQAFQRYLALNPHAADAASIRARIEALGAQP